MAIVPVQYSGLSLFYDTEHKKYYAIVSFYSDANLKDITLEETKDDSA